MTDQDQLIEIAKLDGIDAQLIWNRGQEHAMKTALGELVFGYEHQLVPDYLTSRDAIVPVIEKQHFSESKWESFLRFCVPKESDWIACNKVWNDSAGKIQQSRLPRAYRMLVILSARQLCEALLRATGKWKD